MDVTQKIYNIIKERHIPVKAVCEGANLPLKVMYSTLKENGKRKLRADEFLKICKFLKINPMSLCVIYLFLRHLRDWPIPILKI